MDIFVRDAVETDYVSIVISRDLHNNVEHIICVPLSRKRFRAMGRFGATVVFTQLNTTNVVERLGNNLFRCIVKVNELPRNFQHSHNFVVERGTFQQFLKIGAGAGLIKLEKVQPKISVDDDLEADFILTTPAKQSNDRHSFYSKIDTEIAYNTINEIQKTAKKDENHKLESVYSRSTPFTEIFSKIKRLPKEKGVDVQMVQKNLVKKDNRKSLKDMDESKSPKPFELAVFNQDGGMFSVWMTKEQMQKYLGKQLEAEQNDPETDTQALSDSSDSNDQFKKIGSIIAIGLFAVVFLLYCCWNVAASMASPYN
eukprot:NP_509980.1 Uncharacterized protein CELE_F54F7.6 [Caenorhabditis elegans]